MFLHLAQVLFPLQNFLDNFYFFLFREGKNIVMVSLMLRTKAGLTKMDQTVVSHVFCPQHVSAAALLQAVIEHEKIALFVVVFEEGTQLKRYAQHFLGNLKNHAKSRIKVLAIAVLKDERSNKCLVLC